MTGLSAFPGANRTRVSVSAACSALVVFAAIVAAQSTAPASKTRAHVEALASPRLEGRLTGSTGEKLAGDYLVGELKKIGAKPVPGQRDYLLPFQFTAGTRARVYAVNHA